MGLGLGAGEFPDGVSDSGKSSHRFDLLCSVMAVLAVLDVVVVDVSTESFFDFPVPLIILRFAADKIPDMMSLAELRSRFGFRPD